MGESRDTFDMLRMRALKEPGAQLSRLDRQCASTAAGWVLEAAGAAAFYIEVPNSVELQDEVNAKGFAVEVSAYAHFDSQRALMIRLRDASMESAFASMIDDVLETAQRDTDSPLDAVARVTVERWREMFKTTSLGVLSRNDEIGLLAELHLLTALIDAGVQDVIGAWHFGGVNSKHDFAFITGDVEVKATTARESFDITIHGLEQLSTDDGRGLVLYAEQLEERPDGQTLPEAVIELERRGVARILLREKLEECGYFEAHASAYTSRFSLVRCKARGIDDSMPRIAKSYLPPEARPEDLKSVSYTVDFGPVPGVESDEAIALVKAVAVG